MLLVHVNHNAPVDDRPRHQQAKTPSVLGTTPGRCRPPMLRFLFQSPRDSLQSRNQQCATVGWPARAGTVKTSQIEANSPSAIRAFRGRYRATFIRRTNMENGFPWVTDTLVVVAVTNSPPGETLSFILVSRSAARWPECNKGDVSQRGMSKSAGWVILASYPPEYSPAGGPGTAGVARKPARGMDQRRPHSRCKV